MTGDGVGCLLSSHRKQKIITGRRLNLAWMYSSLGGARRSPRRFYKNWQARLQSMRLTVPAPNGANLAARTCSYDTTLIIWSQAACFASNPSYAMISATGTCTFDRCCRSTARFSHTTRATLSLTQYYKIALSATAVHSLSISPLANHLQCSAACTTAAGTHQEASHSSQGPHSVPLQAADHAKLSFIIHYYNLIATHSTVKHA